MVFIVELIKNNNNTQTDYSGVRCNLLANVCPINAK